MQVFVRDNNVDQALKVLKKRMQREGIFREMRLRKHYEKPSERRARERSEAIRRARNCPKEIAARRPVADEAADDPGCRPRTQWSCSSPAPLLIARNPQRDRRLRCRLMT